MKKIDKLLNNIDEDQYLDNEKSLSENEKEKICFRVSYQPL